MEFEITQLSQNATLHHFSTKHSGVGKGPLIKKIIHNAIVSSMTIVIIDDNLIVYNSFIASAYSPTLI